MDCEPHVRRGEVKTIRVVRDIQKTVRINPQLRAFGFQFPVISCGATYAAKDVIGEVPVEPDGSALFHVPARVNVSFMALDEQGRAVQRMRSFTHLMPGERQGCVGCHETAQPDSPAAAGDGRTASRLAICSRPSGEPAGSTTRASCSRCWIGTASSATRLPRQPAESI